jgi:hypothetical protein
MQFLKHPITARALNLLHCVTQTPGESSRPLVSISACAEIRRASGIRKTGIGKIG